MVSNIRTSTHFYRLLIISSSVIMGSGDLNLKKQWHPATYKNRQLVQDAQAKHAAEQLRLQQWRREQQQQQQEADLKRIAKEAGLSEGACDFLQDGTVGESDAKGSKSLVLNFKKAKAAKLDWMYGDNSNNNGGKKEGDKTSSSNNASFGSKTLNTKLIGMPLADELSLQSKHGHQNPILAKQDNRKEQSNEISEAQKNNTNNSSQSKMESSDRAPPVSRQEQTSKTSSTGKRSFEDEDPLLLIHKKQQQQIVKPSTTESNHRQTSSHINHASREPYHRQFREPHDRSSRESYDRQTEPYSQSREPYHRQSTQPNEHQSREPYSQSRQPHNRSSESYSQSKEHSDTNISHKYSKY